MAICSRDPPAKSLSRDATSDKPFNRLGNDSVYGKNNNQPQLREKEETIQLSIKSCLNRLSATRNDATKEVMNIQRP